METAPGGARDGVDAAVRSETDDQPDPESRSACYAAAPSMTVPAHGNRVGGPDERDGDTMRRATEVLRNG